MKPIISFSLFLSLFFISSFSGVAQRGVQTVDSLIVDSGKQDIWIPFMESYRDLDFKKLKSIHTSDITRVSTNMNLIQSGEPYLQTLNSFFEQIKGMNYEMNIRFSIISSATSENKVYQKGYYTIGLRADKSATFRSTGYSVFTIIAEKSDDG